MLKLNAVPKQVSRSTGLIAKIILMVFFFKSRYEYFLFKKAAGSHANGERKRWSAQSVLRIKNTAIMTVYCCWSFGEL